MRLDKNKALKLRLQGKSYGQIHQILGVPKATLSDWFSSLELSQKANKRIQERVNEKSIQGIIKRNKLQTHLAQQRARATRGKSIKEIKTLSKKDIFLLGISLYWAEGYKRPIMKNGKVKTHHPVSMTNSDPYLIKIFLRFLREVCKVPEEKISANIRIYEHQNANYLLDFWSKTTGIAPSKLKTFYYKTNKSNQDTGSFYTLPYGTIQIRVNNTELYHKIMGWIEGLTKQA